MSDDRAMEPPAPLPPPLGPSSPLVVPSPLAAAVPREVDAGPVVLRQWAPGDVEAMARSVAESIEHIRPWMPWAAAEPLSPADRAELIAQAGRQWERGESFSFGMFAGDLMVGSTGLHPRIGPGGIEIGYWVHVDWVGRGIATATTRALTSVAVRLPGIDRVEIHHDRANVASRRIPEKLGYRLVAEVPDVPEAPGEEGVELRWRTTPAAWLERHG